MCNIAELELIKGWQSFLKPVLLNWLSYMSYYVFIADTDGYADNRPGMRGGHQMCIDVYTGW